MECHGWGTQGTADRLEKAGVSCERVLKIQEGRPNASDLLKNGEIQMLLLTTKGAASFWEGVRPLLSDQDVKSCVEIGHVSRKCNVSKLATASSIELQYGDSF